MSTSETQNNPGTSSSGSDRTVECRTNLLLDEPESVDAFSGPHGRIAKNIASLILPSDAKGISIGVEGSWGSGKSTVAKLLTKELKQDPRIAVISFDAWAHEGDPLRRTFLEALIGHLQTSEWITPDYWDEQIEVLANRRETVTTKDKLTISKWGIVAAFLLPVIPIGGVCLAAASRENITFEWGPIAWRFWIYLGLGLLLTFIPYFILLWRYKHEADIIGIFFSKGPTEKTTVTSKTGNPTSIEFEDKFSRLMKEALSEPERRIVILLDNLDRVDAKDALVIWSTLQTFLQHKDERPAWRNRLWIIVLYDLNGISALWQQDKPAATDGTEPQRNQIAASFIDKSFQIRFEVPSLVLSDWRGFLVNKLKEAFPDHNESDLHEVYRVLAIAQAKGAPRPTIRELKLFINQVGSVHRQWSASADRPVDTFPLGHIAYYVHLRRMGTDITSRLLDPVGMFPDTEYADLLGEKLRENLAAMVFNVEVDIAQQLLFTDRIKNALTLASSDELIKIEAQIPKGFWEMFEQIVTTEWTGEEVSKIADAAWALEESRLLNKAPAPSVRSVMRTMCEQAAGVDSWLLDERKARGLSTFMRWRNDPVYGGNEAKYKAFVETLFSSTANGLKQSPLRGDFEFEVKSWLPWLHLILTDLSTPSKDIALTAFSNSLYAGLTDTTNMLAKSFEVTLEVMSEIADNSIAARTHLEEFVSSDRITKRFATLMESSANTIAWGMYVLFRYGKDFDLTAILGKATAANAQLKELMYGDSAIKTLTELLDRFNQLPLLYSAYKQNEELKAFVVSSIKSFLKTDMAIRFFDQDDALERIEFAGKEAVGSVEEDEALTMIAKKLLSEKSLAEKMVVGQFHPESSWLYELVFDEPIADHSSLLRWCEPGLVAVSLEEWKYQLQHSGQILKLAFRVNRSVAPRELDLGPNYFEALKQYASALTGSDSFPTIFPSNAASLLGGIESPVRLSFRDHLLAAMDTNQKEFFDQFGEELAMHLIFSGRGGEILTHFASNQSTFQGLVWLNQTLSQHTQEFLEKYSSLPELQVLKESIERKLSETNTNREIFTPLVGIAQILQIEVLPGGNLAVEVVKSGRSQLEMVDHYGVRGTLMSLAPNESASKIQPALSPDGTNLAYVTSDPTFKEVRVVNLSDNRRIDLFRDESLTTSRPSWSPDNGTLAYVKDSSICSVAIQTGDQKTHTLGANDDRPSWSPDGEQIAFHRSSGDKTAIFVVTAKGNAPVRLSQNGSKDMEPSWSPDGTRLLFVRHTDGQDPAVYEMDSSGGTYEKYLFSDPDPHSPIWMIDKKIILFQSGSGADGVIYRYNLETRVKKKITSGVNFSWVPQPILE